jgi:hypothetical protein
MLRKIFAAAFAAGLAAVFAGDLRAEPIASYRISCRYDEGKKTLEGRERLDWRNTSSRPAAALRFEMPGNALRNNRSTFWREARSRGAEPESRDGSWGSLTVSRMSDASGEDLLSQMHFVSPEDGNADDRTVLEIPLPKAVLPGATIRLDVDFVSRLPRLGARGGWKGEFLLANDWFPAIGVLDEGGWRAPQLHFGSETFSDPGDFDVVIDLPSKFKGRVGATGRLLEERDAPGNRVLEHFRAEAVRSFAWAADPGFEVETDKVPSAGLPDIELTLLAQAEHRIYRPRFLRAARIAITELQKRYGPCPFPSLTIADIPWGPGGALRIVAPGLVAGRTNLLSPDGVWADGSPEAIAFDGIAAQWFEEAVVSDPVGRPPLGRALSRYLAARINRLVYGNSRGVLPLFGFPIVLHSVEVRPEPPPRLGAESGRIEAAFATFERIAGEKSIDKSLAAYFREFRQRHPRPEDFVSLVERTAGPVWGNFFRDVLRGSGLDLSVARAVTAPSVPPIGIVETGGRSSEVTTASAARRRGYDTEVLIDRRGEVVVPVDIRLDFDGRRTYRTVWNGASDWIRFRVEDGPKLLKAVVDPDAKITLDANRNNNGRVVRGDAAAANLWTARAFFWSENLIDLFMELW